MELILPLIVGITSLGVSIWVAVRQDRLQRRLAAIEVERRSEEVARQKAANVTARLEKGLNSRGRTSHRLVLTNMGEAPARNVSMTFTRGGSAIIMEPDDLPIPFVDVGQEFRFIAAPSHGDGRVIDVAITWEDDTGAKEKSLRIPIA